MVGICKLHINGSLKELTLSLLTLIRYGRLNTDWTKSFSKPCSWDREMLIIALITELAKNVKLKTEYYINDEVLVQLEFKF